MFTINNQDEWQFSITEKSNFRRSEISVVKKSEGLLICGKPNTKLAINLQ